MYQAMLVKYIDCMACSGCLLICHKNTEVEIYTFKVNLLCDGYFAELPSSFSLVINL